MILNKVALISSILSLLVYVNTFKAGFVYDDRRAIIQNPDVIQLSPIGNLLINDYWGSSLNYSGSHGSYRPITVFTFRLNHYFFGLNASAFHVTNVLLHCLTTYLFCVVVETVLNLNRRKTFLAGLLFAFHPIHTEAVAGIVGRADILATLFCLTTIFFYAKSCNCLKLKNTNERENANFVKKENENRIETLMHSKHAKASKMKRKKLAAKRNQKNRKNENVSNQPSCLAEIPVNHFLKDKRHFNGDPHLDLSELTDDSNSTTDTYDSPSSNASAADKINSINNDLLHQVKNCLANKDSDFNPSEVVRYKKWTKINRKRVFSTQMSIQESTGSQDHSQREGYIWLLSAVISAVCATLSKENGFCALLLCVVYDLTIQKQIWEKKNLQSFVSVQLPFKPLQIRIFLVSLSWIALMTFRIGLPIVLRKGNMSFPEFSSSDNPAAASKDFLTRALTFSYLIVCNVQMLFFPITLNFDWSMDAIPLISSVYDRRNIATAIFCISICFLINYIFTFLKSRICWSMNSSVRETAHRNVFRRSSCTSSDESLHDLSDENHNFNISRRRKAIKQTRLWKSDHGLCDVNPNNSTKSNISSHFLERLLFSSAVISLSLLPASNIFFYVGFVLAERLLYLPSIASCILIVDFGEMLSSRVASFSMAERLQHSKLQRKSRQSCQYLCRIFRQFLLNGWLILIICHFASKTTFRNLDWKNEMTLYSSGTTLNPAKAFANLGSALRNQGEIDNAEQAYLNALKHRPNMADVHYNLGVLYQETGRREMAEERYRLAIKYRPGMAIAHLNLGVVLAEQNKFNEAKTVYRITADLINTGTKDLLTHIHSQLSALFNLGCLLADEGKHLEAVGVFKEAAFRPLEHYQSHSLYNMLGQSLFHLNRIEEAEKWFKFSLDSKPDHVPSHLTYAQLLTNKGSIKDAQLFYEQALMLESENKEVYMHYSSFLLKQNESLKAALLLTRAAEATFGMNDYNIILNAASAYRQAQHYHQAEKFYRRAVEMKPNISVSHLNLGAILHLQKKFLLAEKSYLRALELEPGNQIISANLEKLRRSF